ncbi:hypothetical protein KP509_27G064000 [Ceratopteris richardii]|uniref:RanBP2-type domain-containing protein n=1 Tax=Ceratopteris richardii TaxID=49495 RepID=A0A8T2RJI0_CERRI|nr:hypothetical protein KP509_27G064000 [Ceratopteris richardii]
MWKGSWRLLLQMRQSTKLLPIASSAHLRLQGFRFHDVYSATGDAFLSTSGGFFSATFSTTAEAESLSSENHRAEEFPSGNGYCTRDVPASTLEPYEEQVESSLNRIIIEHRQLMKALITEIEGQRNMTNSILDEVRALTSKKNPEIAGAQVSEKTRPLLEWSAFMEHLLDTGYFNNGKVHSSYDTSILEDPAHVNRAIQRFSLAHESIFGSLSQIDLRILARYGCVDSDPKAALSQKRLRQHFQHKETVSYKKIGREELAIMQPNLLDVMRLIYSTLTEGTSGEDVRSCISHLLRELITFSLKSKDESCPISTGPNESNSIIPNASDTIEASKTDNNTLSKLNALKSGIVSAERTMSGKTEVGQESRVQSSTQWKCPRCSFMNLDTKHRCVECSRRRPQRTYTDGTAKCIDDVSLEEDDIVKDSSVNSKQMVKVKERKDSKASLTTRGQASSKVQSSSLSASTRLDTDEDSDDVLETSSDDRKEDGTGKDPYDVLDDILDSDGSEEDTLDSLSDESKGGSRSHKKSSLSSLFPVKSSGKSGKIGSSGRRYEDVGESRRFGRGVVGDEEEDDFNNGEASSSRRIENWDDEDRPRRYGRGSSRGRRDSSGFRRSRGDPYDDRFNDTDMRSNRGRYGEKDMGSRYGDYGGRSRKGRPRY